MPRSSMSDTADVLVIGSGFGASVAAYRLADAGKRVVVMERGRRFAPGDFARTPSQMATNFWDPSERLYGLFDAWTFRGLEGLVSSGLGGGSLIYANVLLRKDENWFVKESPIPGGGYESWPFERADLDPHYDAVEKMMGATPYPYDDTPKTRAFEGAAVRLGVPTIRPPLAVTFARPTEAAAPNLELPLPEYGNLHGRRRVTCTLCGECDMGCNTGAKNTLDHNYLSAAAHRGADVRVLHEVRGIRPDDDGGYLVSYVVHDPDGVGASSTRALPVRTIRARRVVVGAGTFGSTFLLLRNRTSLRGLSPALGTRFSGNGDLLTFLMNCTRDGKPLPIDGGRGTVITSAIRVPDAADGGRGRGFYIEDAGFPSFLTWLVEMGQFGTMGRRAAIFGWNAIRNRLFALGKSNISSDLSRMLGDGHISGGSLPLLGMGRDTPDGRMSLKGGRLAVNWTAATSRPYFARMRALMNDIGDELGADFQDNPLWWVGRVITVHPLGGVPAGRHRGEGVVDEYGEAFGHPGLHVLDGSAMPGPVGANPSLTIAAFSDRASERMLEQKWNSPRRRAGARTTIATGVEEASEEALRLAALAQGPGPGRGGPSEPSVAVRPQGAEATHRTDASERTNAMDASTSSATPGGGSATPAGGSATAPTSVAFTETMRGAVTLGETDPVAGGELAKFRHDDLVFELTITAPDVAAFTADPLHTAEATGWVEASVLGGRVDVTKGWFNLFVRPEDRPGRRMLYRLWVADAAGTPVTLIGFKDISDDAGFDLWKDTTTLFVRLLDGHVPPPPAAGPEAIGAAIREAGDGLADSAEVIGAGMLEIKPLDFAAQMTTFRTTGPDGAAGLAAFGSLFLGELWKVYLTRETSVASESAGHR